MTGVREYSQRTCNVQNDGEMIKSKAFQGMNLYTVSQTMLP
ncbi:hypothetical protein BN4901_1005 [Citrobacter europaeus]|uniref:Transposase n=1 Tax=Citrobacter europaeus TaxID=1914243 RepID=A0ABY0JXV2_9ENTR|nr:hypothetical protein CIP106467_3329 [Citrobacter europaeus]SCA75135.1 hypothetical protein BN4901_1005 [Citrobacter europaeus]